MNIVAIYEQYSHTCEQYTYIYMDNVTIPANNVPII